MKVRTSSVVGLVLAMLATLAGCSSKWDEAVPSLPLSADPAAEAHAATPDRGTVTTDPLTPMDASTLPSTGFDHDGAAEPHADAGADAARLPPVMPSADGGQPVASCGAYPSALREHEANDTVVSANALGALVCGTLDSANDVDWYTVDAPAGLAFTFDPQDDALITVRTPANVVGSAQGIAFYRSSESGRFTIVIRSPGHRMQAYLLVRD